MLKPIAQLMPPSAMFIALYVSDIEAHPECYKASVRADPKAAAIRLIDGLDDNEVRQLTRDLRAEIATVERLTA